MPIVTGPLRPNDSGQAVADLHKEENNGSGVIFRLRLNWPQLRAML
jgi:hypothetical protein